jgi:thiamine biosynthesis lipoprotein
VQAAIAAAFDEFRAVDKLLSIHRPDSALARANDSGDLSPELAAIIQRALAVAKETDGAFDPTIRPLADLWGFIKKEGYRMPTETELRIVLTKVNFRHIEIIENQFIKGAHDMTIDSGGFGKGYAVDRAIAALQRHGIQNAMVKAGGDLRVIGLPPGKNHWIIQLEDPQKKGQRTPVKLSHGAMSTSGQYENFMIIEGKRYGHLLDPRTGKPIQGIAACTLTAPTCFESDAYATAAAVMGVKKSKEKLGGRFGMRFVLMDDDGKLRVLRTTRFPK